MLKLAYWACQQAARGIRTSRVASCGEAAPLLLAGPNVNSAASAAEPHPLCCVLQMQEQCLGQRPIFIWGANPRRTSCCVAFCRYNLFREASEGWAKVLVSLDKFADGAMQNKDNVIRTVSRLCWLLWSCGLWGSQLYLAFLLLLLASLWIWAASAAGLSATVVYLWSGWIVICQQTGVFLQQHIAGSGVRHAPASSRSLQWCLTQAPATHFCITAGD